MIEDTRRARDPAGEGGEGDRARARIAAGPAARYLVGLDAKVQARLKPLIPTRVFDRIVARMMDL